MKPEEDTDLAKPRSVAPNRFLTKTVGMIARVRRSSACVMVVQPVADSYRVEAMTIRWISLVPS